MSNNEMRAHDLSLVFVKKALDGMTKDKFLNEFDDLDRDLINKKAGRSSNESQLFYVYRSLYQKFLTLLNEDDQQEHLKG